MTVLDAGGRSALEAIDETLSQVQSSLDAAARADALDTEAFARLGETLKEVAQRLNANLPPAIDAAMSSELREHLLNMLTRDFAEPPGLDDADAILLEMEAIRHIIRDVLQEQPPVELRDAARAIALLEQWLPGVTQVQLAGLVDLSPRQLQRSRGAGRPASYRLQVVARLVAILRHAWTSQGVVMWFYRPRRELDGRAPVDLLDDPAHERELIYAARAGRVQGAA